MELYYVSLVKFAVSVISFIIIILLTYKWIYNYWDKKKLVNYKPNFYTLKHLIPLESDDYIGVQLKSLYDIAKSSELKHCGLYLFTIPKYMIVHPEYIKHVLQQNFTYFTDRGFYYNKKHDPLSANLFAIDGNEWKYLRAKLSPAFTSAKLRGMIDIIINCGHQMIEVMANKCNECREINIKEMMECYTIDVIGSCAFGIDCNTCKNPNSEFRKQGNRIFAFTSYKRIFKTAFAFYLPDYARTLGVTLFDEETTTFFINCISRMVKFRKNNNINRKDILQILIELDNSENEEERMKSLTAQAFIFFAAGFETSSTTLTFCLFELACNQIIQDELRRDILNVLEDHRGQIKYDAIGEMKYLDQIVNETLRKYPPVAYVFRQCVKNYKIPGTDVLIEKGIDTVVSVLGLHRDSDYYPDPEVFDPERFSDENKKARTPFTYIPFGEGPRNCIGLRFGLMQTKVALILLLKNFKFTLSEKTVLPLTFVKYSFTMVPRNGIYVNLEKI